MILGSETKNDRKQCIGTTLTGVACKKNAGKDSEYCGVHDKLKNKVKEDKKVSKKCIAETLFNVSCKNAASETSAYCGIHNKRKNDKKPAKRVQCIANTLFNVQCRNLAREGSLYCGIDHPSVKSDKKANAGSSSDDETLSSVDEGIEGTEEKLCNNPAR